MHEFSAFRVTGLRFVLYLDKLYEQFLAQQSQW